MVDRIVFYSKGDMASNHSLIKAEKILDNYRSDKEFSINDLLEIYNIQLHFDNNLFLAKWSENDKESYNKILKNNWNLLKRRLVKINDKNIEETLSGLEYQYRKNFWELINQFRCYENISDIGLSKVLSKHPRHIDFILPQKNIVYKFDKVIKDFLLTYEESAEILLTQFEEKKSDKERSSYHFPKSLNLKDKEAIISDYLDHEQANLNYIRLVENSKDSDKLRLSGKTRLKAKKRSQEINNEIFEKGHAWSERVQVGLREDQEEPVKFNREHDLFEAIYSTKFLDSIEDDIELFSMFRHLFRYLDETSVITLVSKRSELNVFERISLKSKNEYAKGEVFSRKEYLSFLQLHILNAYLETKDRKVEDLINSFIIHLNNLIDTCEFVFKIRDSEASYLERIRTVLPDLDFLLRQYQNLAEDGTIDLELIQESSKPIALEQIKSQSNKKYVYSEDNLILQLKHLFFSDQSHLFYTDKYKSKYNNLFDLLTKEKVLLDDFANFQKDIIQNLIRDGYLSIDESKNVVIESIALIYIIRELNRNEMINYWHYPRFIREKLDEMIQEGNLFFENTLFTKEEKRYLNYYLNKRECTNGYDLRNRYLHGTNTLSEDKQKQDYYLLLKVIVLILLKIEDDIRIS